MINNEILSDVKFVFPNCEDKELYSHTYVLSKKSPIFYTMFHGSLKEGSIVKIEDCSRSSFLQLLRYIYVESVAGFTAENVFEIEYLAKKYLIKNLKDISMSSVR